MMMMIIIIIIIIIIIYLVEISLNFKRTPNNRRPQITKDWARGPF
jgi:heme/copper-type cytochrome/quinol oxidase subunit 2